MMEQARIADLREQDAATASVEDNEVFHEDRLPLRLAGHRLPRADDAAFEVFGNGHAEGLFSFAINDEIITKTNRGCSVKVTAT